MGFKKGDVVFLAKRGLIDWEVIDNTSIIIPGQGFAILPNKAYVIDAIGNNAVYIKPRYKAIHPNHFKLAEIINGKVQGINVFKKGDKVKLINHEKIGWETHEYTMIDNVLLNEIYQVSDFIMGLMPCVKLLKFTYGYHPNHFKKVEDV